VQPIIYSLKKMLLSDKIKIMLCASIVMFSIILSCSV